MGDGFQVALGQYIFAVLPVPEENAHCASCQDHVAEVTFHGNHYFHRACLIDALY